MVYQIGIVSGIWTHKWLSATKVFCIASTVPPRLSLVRPQGIEPRWVESKSTALPLCYGPIVSLRWMLGSSIALCILTLCPTAVKRSSCEICFRLYVGLFIFYPILYSSDMDGLFDTRKRCISFYILQWIQPIVTGTARMLPLMARTFLKRKPLSYSGGICSIRPHTLY